MTRWHTDRPVAPLARVSSLASVASVEMYRTDGPARKAFRMARAFYRRKLRQRAKAKAGGERTAE